MSDRQASPSERIVTAMDAYPIFVLGETTELPQTILAYDQQLQPKLVVNGRIEALDVWLQQNIAKNYANDQRIIEQVGFLSRLSKRPIEEMAQYLQSERETTFPPADFMRVNTLPHEEAQAKNALWGMQYQVAASTDILTYLEARGEHFHLTSEGIYQHTELANLCYDPKEKTLSFTLNGEKEVATNAVEAGKLVYGYKEKEAESDIFTVIRKGTYQATFSPEKNEAVDVLSDSREAVYEEPEKGCSM
ncbi:hypothetical protein HB837_14525 [Listeria innocua]|uniref:hypothetical protein n=1 Tax=Listeria innocua TaxID=1642 RepID=UPI0016291479|nr:hypothetical protein [Listeria innocua]MBC1339411.1 hypothetical protein [Listeria innocua]MBC1353651.1 hypothetical protein [Listeria innocua]